MASTAEATRLETETKNGPIIIDMGKRKKKQIKQLQEGTGQLLDEVAECVQELVNTGACAANAQPIVLIVREKPKNTSMLFPFPK